MAPARDSRILFEDHEILVVHRPGASAHTLVTFSDLTFRPRGLRFWGEEVAAKLDQDAVGFVARRENWFPTASVAAAAAAVRAALKPRAIAYGYSMGAYGALKHGALLGVDAAVAVAPQASIAPAEVPWDTRFHRFHRPVQHAGMAIAAGDLAPFAAVLADPYDATDWRHARLVAAAGGAQVLRTPHAGHAAIWLLAGTRTLSEILDAALAGDAAAIRAVLRARRAESGHWFRLMARAAYGRGHDRLAAALWARAAALGVPGQAVMQERAAALAERARRLIALGRPADALAACRDLAALAPRAGAVVGQAAHLMLAAGAPAEAEATFRRALALRARTANLHLGLSLALGAQGRAEEALAAAAAGHAALPLDAELGAHYGHLLNAGGPQRHAEAEAVFRAVLARDPRCGPALHGLSAVLAARGAAAEALALANRAALRMPGNLDVQAWRARVSLAAGEAERAERLFHRLLRAAPARADAHLGRADALLALGRRAEALAALRRALVVLPGDAMLAARLRDLTGAAPRAARSRLVDRLRGLFLRGRGHPSARRPGG